MDKQEIFDKVYRELLRQKVPSMHNGRCLYRGPNGTKCAIGHLIPDELYDEIFNRMSLLNLPQKVKNHIGIEEDRYFFGSLQTAHDIFLCESLDCWHNQMKQIAKEYNLKFNFSELS